MMPTRIQRKRTKGWKMPPNTVYVGRPSKWGNPFRDSPVGGRELSVALYRDMVRGIWNPTLMLYASDSEVATVYQVRQRWFERIGRHPTEVAWAELKGKTLCCWCPLVDRNGDRVPCHADILLELANLGGNHG